MRPGPHSRFFRGFVVGPMWLMAAISGCAAPLVEQRSTPPAVEPPPAGNENDSPAPPFAGPPRLSNAATAALLRGNLLQLLPCDQGAEGAIGFVATVARDGTFRSLTTEDDTVGRGTARCVLSRIAWWRVPEGTAERAEARFTIEFPLSPPTIGDHVAVAAPGAESIDLSAVTQELRRLRPRVIDCLAGRQDLSRMLLFWLRLGDWGKLIDFGVEADTAVPSRGEQAQEHSCLRRVLRLGQFPNPSGGEVTVRFPYLR